MSANTIWKVTVLIKREETVEISAVDRNEAINIAQSNPEVIHVIKAEWKDYDD